MREIVCDAFNRECNAKLYSNDERILIAEESFQFHDLVREVRECVAKISNVHTDDCLSTASISSLLPQNDEYTKKRASSDDAGDVTNKRVKVKTESVDYSNNLTSPDIKNAYVAIRKKLAYRTFSSEERKFAVYFYFLEHDWHVVQPVMYT
jgi:hypothetical protein